MACLSDILSTLFLEVGNKFKTSATSWSKSLSALVWVIPAILEQVAEATGSGFFSMFLWKWCSTQEGA